MAEIREPRCPGDIVWHCSEEDGGPDVGLHIGVAPDVTLWAGEISLRTWEGFPDETKAALGNDGGWWILLYAGKETFVLGKCGETYEAREALEKIALALRLAGVSASRLRLPDSGE